jgi:threonine/homoserine/homoserine lactone efflux protein
VSGSLAPAWAAGFIFGFVASIPVGPVNLTVIDQALRRGFRRALWVGSGAICAETIYAGLALAGLARVPGHTALAYVLRVLAVLFVLLIGVRNFLFTPDEERSSAKAMKLDERWHHPAAWLLGFLMTLSNLTLIILWATLATFLHAHHWVQSTPASRAACIGGVLAGGLVWYVLLARMVSHAHRKSPPQVLHLLVRLSGLAFMGLALLLAYRIFRS